MPSYVVTKPSWFSPKQELRENDRIIGELTMLKQWSYALAEARLSNRLVRFGYKGWTTRTLFIQDAQGKAVAAVKSLSWWKRDTAVTIEGKEYVWKQKNWWGTQSAWYTSDGREIAEFHKSWWGKLQIDSPIPLSDTHMLLLYFGMYLVKLQEMDAAASGMYA